MRDKIVQRVCNFLINRFATNEYRMHLLVVNYLGARKLEAIRKVARDAQS